TQSARATSRRTSLRSPLRSPAFPTRRSRPEEAAMQPAQPRRRARAGVADVGPGAPGLIGRRRGLDLPPPPRRRGPGPAAPPGRGAAAVLRGDPGIGKSALLVAARRAAWARGFRVLTAVGVQPEARLPLAGLHQLLRPVQASAAGLPATQRDALLTAFGLRDGPRPEPFRIALAAMNLLAAVAADHPLAVLADDVHWLDPQSQEGLAFLARRAAGNPIVVVGGARPGPSCPPPLAPLPQPY